MSPAVKQLPKSKLSIVEMPQVRAYVKGGGKTNQWCRKSVSLTPEQDKFVDSNNLNLSAMVREMLDKIMAGIK